VSSPPSIGSPTLVLVPTGVEARALAELGGFGPGLALEESSGFGPIASAARTASILARVRPARVVLVGIAGTYDAVALAVGSAVLHSRVEIEGLETAGFSQAPGIGTGIDLVRSVGGTTPPALLVTVFSPSSGAREVEARRERHPGAVAEDMEGFGVALACALEHVPLAIVRGISNAAGDRETKRWRIRDALSAARDLALDLLRQRQWGAPR
jgi:futalosine hydrolase